MNNTRERFHTIWSVITAIHDIYDAELFNEDIGDKIEDAKIEFVDYFHYLLDKIKDEYKRAIAMNHALLKNIKDFELTKQLEIRLRTVYNSGRIDTLIETYALIKELPLDEAVNELEEEE